MMIVPLQMSLIPLVSHDEQRVQYYLELPVIPELKITGTFVSVWFAHTGFGSSFSYFFIERFYDGPCQKV